MLNSLKVSMIFMPLFYKTQNTYYNECAFLSGCAKDIDLFAKSFFDIEVGIAEQFYIIRHIIHPFLILGYYLQFYFVIIRKDECFEFLGITHGDCINQKRRAACIT